MADCEISSYAQLDPLETDSVLKPSGGAFKIKKRERASIACTRCKRRKQKCNGGRPSCNKCNESQTTCEYAPSNKSTAYGRRSYVKALEDRVAELESEMSKEGKIKYGEDHWQPPVRSQDPSASFSSGSTMHRNQKDAENSINVSPKGCHKSLLPQFPSAHRGNSRALTSKNTTSFVVRDLVIESHGFFVGAASCLALGRVIEEIVGVVDVGPKLEEFASSPVASIQRTIDQEWETSTRNTRTCGEELFWLCPKLADRLLEGYLKIVANQWPILRTAHIRSLHSRRLTLDDVYDTCTLSLIYAIGGKYLETIDTMKGFNSEVLFKAAAKHLEEILKFTDIRAAVMLLLLTIYSLRLIGGPGVWTYAGVAMRLCICYGYHRETYSSKDRVQDVEMRRRIFWSCYCLDRQTSIEMGRPFAISDRDIDISLPTDIDDDAEEPNPAPRSSISHSTHFVPRSTSISHFIHTIHLRQIESRIQQTIYRVDRKSFVSEMDIDPFLDELAQWKATVPKDTIKRSAPEMIDYHGHNRTMVIYEYYKTLRFLLYPQLFVPEVNPKYVKSCAEACAGLCETFQKLHQYFEISFSKMTLQTIFVAGLTMLYCVWVCRHDPTQLSTGPDLSICSTLLHVMAEHWSPGKKYCDLFEVLKSSVAESIAAEKGQQGSRELLHDHNRLNSAFNTLDMDEDGSYQCAQMMTDITGTIFTDAWSSWEVDYTKPATGNTPTEQQKLASRDQELMGEIYELNDIFDGNNGFLPDINLDLYPGMIQFP